MIFEVASLIVINLIIAAIIGFVIGYVIAKSKYSKIDCVNSDNKDKNFKPEVKQKSAINPIFKKNSQLDFKPLVLSSPKPRGKDNLKKIKGIDSQIENNLNTLGIYHFEQISSWSAKNCDWIEEFLHLSGIAKNNQWVDQAKILHSGKETIYSQKVESGEIEVD